MKPESGINNRWELLEKTTGVNDIKNKFNAYSWYNDNDIRISKNNYWSGWWNDYFNFVNIFPKSYSGRETIRIIAETFAKYGYEISPIIDNGISINYRTMTQKESDDMAYSNLLHGGRMSD